MEIVKSCVLKNFVGRIFEYKLTKFPAGELSITLLNVELFENNVFPLVIRFNFAGSDSIIELGLLVDAIRSVSEQQIHLRCDYFPASRHDRRMVEGDCFGLQVYANFIKSMKFDSIATCDNHSDVLGGMFEPGKLKDNHQADIAYDYVKDADVLVSPDAGALKKIYKLANYCKLPVVCAQKNRDVLTGEIKETTIPDEISHYKKILVVDDICDGGRTFIELAKTIKDKNPSAELRLFVTHGIFSKGKEELSKYFSSIETHNDFTQRNQK